MLQSTVDSENPVYSLFDFTKCILKIRMLYLQIMSIVAWNKKSII